MRALVALAVVVACGGNKPTRDTPVTTPPPPVDAAPASTPDQAVASVDAAIPELPAIATTVPTKPDALQDWLIAGHYKAWPHESKLHPSEGPHETVKVFLSPVLAKSLGQKSTQHPVGAAAVKEIYKDGAQAGWAVSVKLAANSNEGKDWYWYEVFSTQPKPKGAFQGTGFRICRDCHFEGGGVDLVRSEFPLQ